MTLGDLRRALAGLQQLPDATPVEIVAHDETIAGAHGAVPSRLSLREVKNEAGVVELDAWRAEHVSAPGI